MIKKYYRLCEYGYLCRGEDANLIGEGRVSIPYELFDELENFVLENKVETEYGPAEFLVPGYKRGIGKVLKAQNYVGLIQTKSNVVIEILPKIYDKENLLSYDKTSRIFLKMLQCLKDIPFKSFNLSSIKSGKMPLFDIFINMFLDELNLLIKKGLKSSYLNTQDNANYYKGKLIVSMHIISNLVHKERFYIEFDEYSRNRSENKIIKSTLLFLINRTNNINLQSQISKYLFAFDDIEESKNIDQDFNKCTNNRLMGDYDKILKWCKIFLKGESFTNFKGNSIAYALLFPMEKVFESYVAKNLRASEYFHGYIVKTQDKRYHLIEKPKKFLLKPDIVLENDDKVIILDTKWKLLNDNESYNYGISQSDLYQMYAYAKKYNSNNIFLLYPLGSAVKTIGNGIELRYEENIKLNIVFIDLENITESLELISNIIET